MQNIAQNHSMILGDARVSTDGRSLYAQVKQLRRALNQLAKGDVLMVTRSRRFRARQQLSIPGPVIFLWDLSDTSPQSDKTVSRETFWYDWQPKNAQGLIRRMALSEVGSRGNLVFLQIDGAAMRSRCVR